MLRQAFVEGNLNAADSKPDDPNWWRKVKFTIEWLNIKNLNELRKLRHDMNCSLLDYLTDDKALDMHWEQAINIQNIIQKDTMPWRQEIEIGLSRKSVRTMVEQWKAIYGDPNDPEVADKIQKTAEHLLKMRDAKEL